LSGEPAILRGWRLTFNIPDFFRIEGGTGNIERAPADEVHGVLYACRDDDMRALDELEALGVTYDRVQLEVEVYGGRAVMANAYVGIPSTLDDSQRPSPRYRSLLIRGAEEMKLDPTYIARLRAIEVHEAPDPGRFEFPAEPDREFTLSSLAERPLHTAIAGAVFDMSAARVEHRYLQKLMAGRDVTVFFLKRMDSSDGTETLDDFRRERLTPEQDRYLQRYLHEFAREYRYAGRIRYERNDRAAAVGTLLRHDPARTRPCRAREVLTTAERINRRLGHENLGFLSESHGFMPIEPPLQSLPRSHAAWDQAAADLSGMYRTLRLRADLARMPLLGASADELPDRYLLRAASVLGVFAHAYHYVEHEAPVRLPESILRPWAEVRKRLGRAQPVLSYIDLIVYNWRLIDPNLPDRMRCTNMRLLVPTVDNREERVFYLTQTEILAQAGPIIGAVVRAQEAVLDDDPDRLGAELDVIIGSLQRIVRESLLNINPNPTSPTYVDPVVWAKTVAPFAVPMVSGVQGPSGTSSPIFNLLDIFFGRRRHQTFLGKEIRALRRVYPPFWQNLLDAVHDVSVTSYVRRTGRPALAGLLKEAVDAYAGKNGFLGRHRMKVYGYLELAFKVGRNVTIGGFSGVFRDRTWDQVDSELESSRTERLATLPSSCHQALIRSIQSIHPAVPWVKSIVLDVSESGVRYEPGDRIGILPENDDAIIDRTLAALRATGSEAIKLTPEWAAAVHLRIGYENAVTLPLREVLRFGRIRPVVPRVAEALHAASQNELLRRAIVDQSATRWELWDLCELLARHGYDPTALWRREPSSAEHICRVVPPETFRMYSISSNEGGGGQSDGRSASEMMLTVGCIRYPGPDPDGEVYAGDQRTERVGTASNFLANAAGRVRPIPFIVEHPPRFGLPKQAATPIVMLAGGTGIAPFRGFILERMRQPDAGEMWLFLATRSPEHLYYVDDLLPALASGRLHLRVAFSREDRDVVFEPDGRGGVRPSYVPGRRRYLQDMLLEPDTARTLWELLRSQEEGGKGAYVYVCGRSRIAREVNEAFRGIIARFDPRTDPAERRRIARRVLARMVGEGRYMQEIFTDARSWDVHRERYAASAIALHNDDDNGHWVVIDNRVYDVSDFIHLHPGGMRVLAGYSGMDATQGYLRSHAGRTEIDAMLEIYEIGVLHQPDFRHTSGEVEGPSGPRTISLAALYRIWTNLLYLLVEMQNALGQDFSLQRSSTTRGEPCEPRSAYRLQRAVETHERFLRAYMDGLTGPPLRDLWQVTAGLCRVGDRDWMDRRLTDVYETDEVAFVEAMSAELRDHLRALIARELPPGHDDWRAMARTCDMLEKADRDFLAEAKQIVQGGVRVFEEHEAAAHLVGADALVGALRALPGAVSDYFVRLQHRLAGAGWLPSMLGDDTPVRQARINEPAMSLLVANQYWAMAEDAERRLVVLTRSASPVSSIPYLIAQNEEVIARIRPEHAGYGVVVDMRQAVPRNDPEFENAMHQLRQELQFRFRRLAVLIESAMGVLQVDRLTRIEGGTQVFGTQSESAAFKFARGEA
ncbi:MAG TPA: cytochrome b5 domain-containing protein, partial [Kofleriaceae bacterium]|nr:cytochrome b5 domain-containing protein [Kofleriaceae bacterium]